MLSFQTALIRNAFSIFDIAISKWFRISIFEFGKQAYREQRVVDWSL